tara:strand:- start:2341 stop:2574 length:234 start_codon:yes stop_codon:yes gene_type:complete
VNRAGRLVVASPETADGRLCVDIFRNAEGAYEWDEWRREPEDPSGWQATGRASAGTFETAQAARQAADRSVEWLAHR